MKSLNRKSYIRMLRFRAALLAALCVGLTFGYLESAKGQSLGSTDFGSVQLGATSSEVAVPVTFLHSGVIDRVLVLSQGSVGLDFEQANGNKGDCLRGTAFSAGDECDVVITFAPHYVGNRYGVVLLEDASGNVLAEASLYGIGVSEQTSAQVVAKKPTSPTSSKAPASQLSTSSTTNSESATSSAPTLCLVQTSVSSISSPLVCGVESLATDSVQSSQQQINFGSQNIGTTSASVSVPVTVTAGGTLNTITVLTSGATGLDFVSATGGTCATGTSYSSGNTCTVNVTFTPKYAGARYGAVVLEDGAGNVLATSYIQGTGIGAQIEFLPGNESTIATSAMDDPSGVAVDGYGNVYITDTNNNRVLKETLSDGTYVESVIPTSTLSGPSGVVIDGAGNIYIADTYNGRVLKEAPSNGSYVETVIPTSTLNGPSGIAVDGRGNIYIADTDNDRILEEELSGGTYTQSVIPTSALNYPQGVAVDDNGDIYIADTYNNRILEESPSSGGYTESVISTSALNDPSGIAIGGNGTIVVVDSNNSRVLIEVPTDGGYTESTLSTSSLALPMGAAIDAAGNVYIADTYNNRVLKEDLSDAPSLSFLPTPPNTTSSDSPQTVTLENSGNSALTLSVPTAGNNPSVAANFSLGSGSTACPVVSAGASSPGTLPVGRTCSLGISFSPTDAGDISGSLVVTDNAGPGTQSISLSGAGTGGTAQSISFDTIAPQNANTIITLSAAATSGLPVGFTSETTSVCAVSGAVATFLSAGTCRIEASQGGNATYAPAPDVSQSFTVNLGLQTIEFDPIPNQVLNSTTPVYLVAAASSGLAASFTSETTSICTVSGATATLLTTGTCTIQANQAGDGLVYGAAPTVTQSFTVESAGGGEAGTNFGSVNIGTTSAVISVPVVIENAGTVGTIAVLTGGTRGLDFASATGGTCATATNYSTGGTCTVDVTFSPKYAGSRYGAVVLEDGSGNVLAMSYIQGTGVGPQIDFLPGTEKVLTTSPLAFPTGVAVDEDGNVYIADYENNRILKETKSSNGTYAETVIPTSTLDSPFSIAVDGAGNLYIADTGNERVLVETPTSTGYTESTLPASTLAAPTGIAVDASGSVYIADSGNDRILKETRLNSGYVESTLPVTSMGSPGDIAIDASGNLYIADFDNSQIIKEAVSGDGNYTQSVIPTSTLANPFGIAIDSSGDIYVDDTYNDRIIEEVPTGSSYEESVLQTSALNSSYGVAVDANGNVYIADSGNNRILEEDHSDAPSLTFTATAPGTTSSDSPQAVTVQNIGNAALDFEVPTTGNNPSISANFALSSSESSACPLVSAGASSASSLTADQTCVLEISFSPSVTGAVTGSLSLTDDSLNAAAPNYTVHTISLTAAGAGSTTQTISFGAIGSQTVNGTVSLEATATSSLPVSLESLTPANCTISGSTAALIAGGTCTIEASQAGNATYAPAPTVTQSFIVEFLQQTISFSPISNQAINSSVPVQLNATASSDLGVSFTSETTSVCTVSGVAATLLTAGTCTIQARQAGDGVVYAAAPTVTQSFTVESAGSGKTGTTFGSVNIGTTSAAVSVPVVVQNAGTVESIAVLTGGASDLDFASSAGGTCATGTSYSSGGTCTVNVTFTPKYAGSRYGAVVLEDSSGNVLATSYIQGIGVGPQISFLPPVEAALAPSGLAYPSGIAVDGSGDIYISDTGNNEIRIEKPFGSGYSSGVIPSSVLFSPSGLAVDGSGNIYIADTGNNRIVEESHQADGYVESVLQTSTLSYPQSVAVDGSGNVYIADTNNNRILKETLSNGIYTESVVPTSTLNYPEGIAVDGSGDIYIADTYNDRILEESFSNGNYTESVIPTRSLNYPTAIAVDSVGEIYIADTYNNRILRETPSNGTYVETVIPTSLLYYPGAIAIDGQGNLYVADTENNRTVKEDFSNVATLNFQTTVPGATSSDSPQAVTIGNAGNSSLDLTAITFPDNFSLGVSTGSVCTANTPVAALATCSLPIDFTPSNSGPLAGTVELTDNTLNAASPQYATQSISVDGIGAGSTAQTISFAAIGAQTVNETVSLTAAATSSLQVSLESLTPAICTVSGSTADLIAGGTCTIEASQAGNATYAPAPIVTQSFAVEFLQQTISFYPISNQLINVSAPMQLYAYASSNLTVSFTSETTSVCTVSGVAATLLTTGTCTIQASQAGDGVVYAAAPTVTQSFTVVNAGTGETGTNFGSVDVGATSAAVSVPVVVENSGTVGNIAVLTGGASGLEFASAAGGTCATGTSYSSGNACTVNVTFAPKYAGSRYGAVVLEDSSGNVLATSYIQGTGVGAQISFLPPAESAIAIGDSGSPASVAIDGNGDVFVADSANNRILKETLSNGVYTESLLSTSALSGPSGIAVDAAGNVYISDSYDDRVLKETLLPNGSYSETVLPTSGLGMPEGIAVDGQGDVYIADIDYDQILVEAPTNGGYTQSEIPTSPLDSPVGVAVDGSGDVYIADSWNARVLKETLSNGTYSESTIPIGSQEMWSSLAVDDMGDVYVADSLNNQILVEAPSGNGYSQRVIPISWPLSANEALSVDSAGNIYVGDGNDHQVVKEETANGPTLSFATTAPGSTSSDSPQTVTIENTGNATLTFPVPSSGTNPSIPAGFALNTSGGSSCALVNSGDSSGATLPPDQSCSLLISFTPSVSGEISGSLEVTDNTSDASAPEYAVQTVALSGIGAGTESQTINFDSIGTQTVDYEATLTATASSGLPVNFSSLTPGICSIIQGVQPVTILTTSVGTCTMEASQPGNATYAPAPAVTQSFSVTLFSQTISFSAIQDQPINQSVPVELVASASSNLPVSFISQTPSICTVSGSAATLLMPGTCTVQASQPGNGETYAAASPVAQSFTVESLTASTGTNFGSVNLGATSAAVPVAMTVENSGTVENIAILTQGVSGLDFASTTGGSCATGTDYSAGSTCTVDVTFAPKVAGSRYGAVVLEDSSGSVLATSYVQGSGIGPEISFLPSPEVTVTSSTMPERTLNSASGVAVDALGDVYIADTKDGRILKESPADGAYTETVVPTGTLGLPAAIAIDGSGALYIADTQDNMVVKETPSGSGYVQTTVASNNLLNSEGVAVDGSGDVFIADTDHNQILEERLVDGTYVQSVVPTSQLYLPEAVAVDGDGNIYIADSGNQRILKEAVSANGYDETIIPTTPLEIPSGITVDSVGNIYFSDSGLNEIFKETLTSSGQYVQSIVQTSGLSGPRDLVTDGSGNLYIADVANNRVIEEDFTAPSGLSFQLTEPGSTSSDSPQFVTLVNSGNAALSFIAPASGNNPQIATPFELSDTAPLACPVLVSGSSNSSVLAAGQNCTLSVDFAPSSAGNFTGSLGITDNSLNAAAPEYATQAISLSGTGLGSTPQTITFNSISDQMVGGSASLVASASSGLPVTFSSLTPEVCTTSGASAVTSASGTCTIQANQSGSSTYAPAPAVTQSFTVAFLPPSDTNFGAANIGTTSGSQSISVTIDSAGTISNISVVTEGDPNLDFANAAGGSCTAATSYSAGDTCTVNVTFTPHFSGTRSGAVLLEDTSGNVLGTSYVQGTGIGPQLAFLPGTETIPTGDTKDDPQGIAVDAAGNIYISDGNVGEIIKETPTEGGGYTTSDITAINNTYGLAVDGAGNLYIADAGDDQILKETPSGTGYTQSTIPTSALKAPSDVAVDTAGRIYIADTENNRILIETPTSNGYEEATIPTSPLIGPSEIAVDGNGNIYVIDSNNERVLKETLSNGSYSESTVLSSGSVYPGAIAVDGNGNVYIDDPYNPRIIKEALIGPNTYSQSIVNVTIPDNVIGLAVDGAGNLYIASASIVGGTNGVTKVDVADPPTLNFVATPVGGTSSDSPQVVTLQNVGNASLTFPAPSSGDNPGISSNFVLDSTASTACPVITTTSSSPGTLDPNQTCTLSVDFEPGQVGALTGDLTLLDNTLNASSPGYAAQNIVLNGAGTGTVATPVFSLGGGTYTSTQTVTITDATADSTIYYTTDGSTPTTSSTQYIGPITVNSTETINAIGVETGDTNSAVATAAYTISGSGRLLLPSMGVRMRIGPARSEKADSTPGVLAMLRPSMEDTRMRGNVGVQE